MPIDPASAYAFKIGAETLVRTAPKGFSKLRTVFLGNEIVVVGPARAGKTTFFDFLGLGELGEESDEGRTSQETESSAFEIPMGKREAVILRIKKVIDLPGQAGAYEHANCVFDRNPHAVVIMLDSTKPFEGEVRNNQMEWLSEFLNRLDFRWRYDSKSKRSRLKSLTVVVNKIDKTPEWKPLIRLIRKAFQPTPYFLGARGDFVRILPSILINHDEAVKYGNRIISSLARDLVER